MENLKVSDGDNGLWSEKIAEICSDVTIGCSDVNAIVTRVINSSDDLVDRQQQMMTAINALEGNQNSVIAACEAARNLSQKARDHLENSSAHIRTASNDAIDLVNLFQNLTNFIGSFAGSIEEIKQVTKNIDTLARTTNMLALNAAIEAEKAGAAGATFGVVANEVKALAKDTKAATENINKTIQNVSLDADNIVAQLQAGISKSEGLDKKFSVVDEMLLSLHSVVDNVSDQNENASEISENLQQLMQVSQSASSHLSQGIKDNNAALKTAQTRTDAVEQLCNNMFDLTVKNGFSPADDYYVALAFQYHEQIHALTDKALKSGDLSSSDLFDRDYKLVPGSNPKVYQNQLTDWAAKKWRPEFDRMVAYDSKIQCVVCTDINGFIVTHISRFSKPITNDPGYNAANCRSGRIVFSGCDVHAKQSVEPYTMAVYCVEDGLDISTLVRNVYIPLYWNNQRWGDLELAYSI